jgi:hypothetical protein
VQAHKATSIVRLFLKYKLRNYQRNTSRSTVTEIDHTSKLTTAIAEACPSTVLPINIGLTIGRVLYNIEQLVSLHLENPVDFQLPVPQILRQTPELVHAITSHMAHLREAHNIPTGL